MNTVFVGNDVEVDALLARRRALRLDGRDEVWEGVHHVTPYEHARGTRTAWRLGRLLEAAADAVGLECLGPFNLGAPQDFRIPDMVLVPLDAADGLYNDTAAVVIKVLSPNDETFQKFGFYAIPEVVAILARRRETGLAERDEIWDGVYHALPPRHSRNGEVTAALSEMTFGRAKAAGLVPTWAINVGEPDDVRVPDLVCLRPGPLQPYAPTAALVVELRFPHDEVMEKFGFYAAHGVGELWVVDPLERTVRIWQLDGAGATCEYAETGCSDLLDLTAATVQAELDWPEG